MRDSGGEILFYIFAIIGYFCVAMWFSISVIGLSVGWAIIASLFLGPAELMFLDAAGSMLD